MAVTRISPLSEREFIEPNEALAALCSDIAAGAARDGAPRIVRNENRIVLTYSDNSKISYLGDFGYGVGS